ncbi:MAG: AMP-binding protein [Acetivibrionales bacterium]|jgi:long-chain acyl-CoA synthetase|nr:AMP-binding protein [Bacillota bacterium]NLP08173.1 long-chain fatty acid--CoA ligase [Clostridiaceae bacterium]HOA54768.1 AMP-binding protein [Clostridiales bacterium]HPZ05406.1 AMP-binding protein [Clostridiales bacterium]HQD30096.1 AMP-binding protein [Clostridiales bacterium]
MKNIPLYEVRKIRSIKELMDTSAELYSDRTAFLYKPKGNDKYVPVTFRQFKADVDALGTALIDIGLKGGRVAIISENRYEWAVSYMAVVNGTGIVVPLDKELPENEIENLLIRSKADAVIFSDNLKNSVLNIAKRIDFIKHYIIMDDAAEKNGSDTSQQTELTELKELIEKGRKKVAEGCRDFIDAEIDTEALSILLFTSATTDTSKAVMLSHRNIAENLMAMSSMLNIVPDDVFLSVLPLHHTYENTCGFLCPHYRGAAVAYCEGLRHIVKNLQEAKATVMLGVPLIYESIYKRIWDQAAKNPKLLKKLKFGLKLSGFLRKFGINITKKLFAPIHNNFGGNIRIFISGAAGIDPEVARGFRNFGIHFVQGYGLTECSPIVALNRDVDFKDEAAGLPLPGLEVRIDGAGSDGVGEIVVKGPSVMMGYYEDPENTAEALKDGWFYTGDLGFIDDDGFVHITGRKKNVIVTKNGKNIYPEEVETLLNKSRYIKECIVFGKDDPVYGDIVVSATIVPEMEIIESEFEGRKPTEDEIREIIRKEVKEVNKSLVTYKYVKDFNIRYEEFEKTTTRKIKRYVKS